MTDARGSDLVTGARALVDCLLREGVDHIWGIPGTQNLPLIDVLRDTPEIRFILTRHEQGAAFMAHGFARASGRSAVITATEGPGVTNLPTGLAASFKGFVPIISICGEQEEWLRERESNQDIDQVSFLRPITKWAAAIPSADKVQELTRKAFRIALAEPCGPVHLQASRDVFLQETRPEPFSPPSYRAPTPACPSESLDAAAAVLASAERPLIVVGGGVVREGLVNAIKDLAERTGIPVAALQFYPDAFPTDHSLALGMLGRNGWGSANRSAPRADVIVAIGAHVDYYSSLFRNGVFTREAKLIHHSPAFMDVGAVYPVAVGATGSTRSFVEGLAERVARNGQRWEWLDVGRVRAEWDAERNPPAEVAGRPIPGPFLARAMRHVLPRNGLMVLDAGNAGKHVRPHYDTYEPGTFITMDDWPAVGGAFPIALGAKVARPDRPVMVTLGDMGMMCNFGEVETAVRENIPVVCVVFNDSGLGNERAYQNDLYGGRFYAVDYGNVDFAALGRALGAFGVRVEEPGDLEGALNRALQSGKPAIVDVVIDRGTLAPVKFST